MLYNFLNPTFAVAAAELALGGVAVAEAGRAAELVVSVDKEVSGLAAVAALAFDVLLAVAVAGGVVAARRVVQAALGQAAASLATEAPKVPVVDLALHPIKLVRLFDIVHKLLRQMPRFETSSYRL